MSMTIFSIAKIQLHVFRIDDNDNTMLLQCLVYIGSATLDQANIEAHKADSNE